MTQRSKAKDYIAVDKLSVGSLELHRQSTGETACLVFNSKLHLWLNNNYRGKAEYTYGRYSPSVGKLMICKLITRNADIWFNCEE
jgi:hypothetical protein